MECDVAIAGAGPGGCATALSLADFAPELSVCLLGPTSADGLRVGETVPPPIERLLDHLGLWSRFQADGHHASYRTISAWGSPHLASNEFLFHAHQIGWRLDRAKFDRMMQEAAADRVAARLPQEVAGLSRERAGWRLILAEGSNLYARFVIDATGHKAALARSQRLPASAIDALVGCSVEVADRCDEPGELLLETFADGWWYTVALPGSRRVLVCMTDADQARRLGLRQAAGFLERVEATEYIRRVMQEAQLLRGPRMWAASSRHVVQCAALPLLCVGDAGVAFDPVAGQGIARALCSGIFASYAAADFLRRGDDSGLRRYAWLLDRHFATYRAILREFYALETRWATRPFWCRRIGRVRGLVA
jgi:2-polyprenyl-6-methoxyphenol hydroxylase-like FAD-dependent oxidoreductase